MNLLTETIDAIRKSGHCISEIIFIGSEETGHRCTWQRFKELADEDYDNGFGAVFVATDLVIAFRDGQKLWRGEYDGSEWWEFCVPFKEPKDKRSIRKVIGKSLWRTLEDMEKESR